MIRPIAVLFAVIAAPGIAHAHAGHVAEVAGHAHWIALGAIAAAAAIASALAATKEGRKDQESDSPDAEEDAAEGERA